MARDAGHYAAQLHGAMFLNAAQAAAQADEALEKVGQLEAKIKALETEIRALKDAQASTAPV